MDIFKTPDFDEYQDDALALAIKMYFEDRIKTDDDFCCRLWSSLANVAWYLHEKEYSFSFRGAGSLIAAIRSSGNYMDWYCSGVDGKVNDEISSVLEKDGWTYKEL